MHSVTVIILLPLVAHAHTRAASHASDVQEPADKVVDNLVNNLLNRVLRALPVHSAGLDDSTLGKPGNLVSNPQARLRPLLPTQAFHQKPGRISSPQPHHTLSASPPICSCPQIPGMSYARPGQPIAAATRDFGDVPAMPTRRVVVTGLGIVTPLGYDVPSTWQALLAGKTGVKKIVDPKFEGLPTQIAAYINIGNEEGAFDSETILGRKKTKEMSSFMQFAMAASQEAMKDANWHPDNEEDAERTGVALGSGIGGIEEITEAHDTRKERGHRKVSPRFIPKNLINLASGFISMEFNAKGPNTACATACATGAHSIGDAYRFIKFNEADVMIAGGTEAAVEPLSIAGFNQMRALATNRNDEHEKASRPFDEERSGFVMGEGAGVLVLEELEHAKKRGAKIYAEIRGVGYTGDAYHVSAPSGEGGKRAMQQALKQAGLKVADIDYINAHGTSTPVGDEMELKTIQGLFGGPENELQPVVSSTKGATGHALGAAGAIEAVFTTLSVSQDIIPPTLNLENPIVSDGIKHVQGEALKTKVDAALSNSFGFGGTNACICISKPPPT